jgi:apolipoprotein N-acyltransferase
LTSFGVALAGALAAALVRYAVSGRTWAACGAALGVVVLVVGPLTVPLDGRAQAGSLRVAAVQGGGEADPLPDGVSRVRAVFDLHADLSEQLARNLGGDALDLVVWPEDSSGFDLADRPDVAAEIGSLAARVGAPILVGASEYPEAGGRYNVALLIDTDGRILQRYAKRHPVPFGEYIPWRSLARRVTSAVDRVSQDMLAGDEVGVIDLPVPRTGQQVPLGEVICFEVVHDSLVAEAVLAGAQILVVQTNNASFGNSTESAQQLAMSKLRAVEHGRAVVHISTTGESALISPAGIVLESAAAYTPATLVATMPLRTSLTPAAHWGQRLSWAFAALGAALGAIGVATAMTRARRKD